MISKYDTACKTANQMDDHDLAAIDNLTTDDIERVVEELGLDAVPAHNIDNLQSFLEVSNRTALPPSENRPIVAPVSAPRRQLHSMYVIDKNEERKSEYELNKFDPIVFEKNGDIKSEYVGWIDPKTTGQQLVTAGIEVSLEEIKEESSTVTAPVMDTQPSVDNISDFKPEGGVLDPYMQVNRERLFNLLLAYHNQSSSQWNETVTGLGR
ncbi:hypothetical protein PENTCL1PPCAC_26533 [Pristionchus entomophagus]|uniref:Uncharacterized protein n=1 Tax=Pristionchus entomophagus TaxID=358040 RepID=A0AAV5UEB5_9BILA|nr:hypothetical protein PENTCL1PPCAC_26533 [Pristionchus entomophagus]